MELGIHLTRFDFPGGPPSIASELQRVCAATEHAGATWISVMDHFFQIEMMAPVDHAMLEGYTTLGFLAANSSDVRLGLLVTGVTYRPPGLLAKIVATLDVLSNGRATLGLGAAGYEREHRGLGVPFPGLADRFEQLEEALQICDQMWNPDINGAFHGKHFQLDETLCSPTPLSQPRPFTLVGGSGEQKTLRLVAQYADACNLYHSPYDVVRRKLDVLREHCDAVGREFGSITPTMLYRGEEIDKMRSVDVAAEMKRYVNAGLRMVIVMPPGNEPAAWIERNHQSLVSILTDVVS